MVPISIGMAVLTIIASLVIAYLYRKLPVGLESNLNLLKNENTVKTIAGGFASLSMLIVSLSLGMGTSALISKLSINNQLTFNEMWNGFETAANYKEVKCSRDGICKNNYDCDPYTVMVTKTRTVSDGKGGTRVETYQVPETRYHSCPYSEYETSYWVESNLPNTTVSYGKNLMTGDQWRKRVQIPGGRKETPKSWLDAKSRIESGKPFGLTEHKKYKNYILASENSLGQNKSNIEEYKDQDLLPELNTGIVNGKNIKVYNAGGAYSPSYYITDVDNLNGAMAADKKFGDLRVVLVNSEKIENYTDYTTALHAYWSDVKEFGKWALPKNSLTVVIGVNNSSKTVEWSSSFTGMPIGNEGFIQSTKKLKGLKVDQNLLGRPYIDSSGKVVESNGSLENLIWDNSNGFERVSMSGDEDISAGFLYLGTGIQPTVGSMITSGVLWLFFIAGTSALTLITPIRGKFTQLALKIKSS